MSDLPPISTSPPPRRRFTRWFVIGAIFLAAGAGVALFMNRPKALESAKTTAARQQWYCPMHPQVVADKPGKCPICGMPLVLRLVATPVPSAALRTPPPGEIAGRKVLYWYDPMAPGSHFDKPGKSPFMDMQLVPKYADEEPGAPGAAAAPPVSFSAAAIRATGVATVPVTRQDLSDEIRAVGTIEADETKLERVAARVPGRVERLYANFTGQAVRRGAPLFDLYSPDLVATQREYLLAIENRRRLAGASPEAGESAQSLVEAARDRLRLWGISADQIGTLERTGRPDLALTFRSPVSGTVVQKNVVEGQYVQEGTDLYLLADLSSVWLVAQVYEFELGQLRVGQPVTATVSALPGSELSGKVVFIEPTLERETRTARVRIVLPNPRGDLKPGMFANARLAVALGPSLSIPQTAVIDTGARQVVYVETAPGTFSPRDVKLGATAGDRRAVLEGLREGEKVVATANFFVDSQAQLAGGSSIQWSGALEVRVTPTPGGRP
ncbi:MAG TPA: efflux RND transporter periplasmic adaptor subunit [Thermoanaerobaculia bacterium]|jgi:multidrug efflux pump subunit AcrA (membrane-fusion protein)|nr:efflux RND transporter periplasmic adaptor subunit [Thermoanaerobaculia bacterium]HEV8611399.1 efflux RND transporter periplasmic adaptor subunit [Thermoanaerobaculia bacterium]